MSAEEEADYRRGFRNAGDDIHALHASEPKQHPGVGVEEMWLLADKHPSLEKFFEDGDVVLNLAENEKEVFEHIAQKYLDGDISDDELSILEGYYLSYQKKLKKGS